MRRERITQDKAQIVWDTIKNGIRLAQPEKRKLPDIDMSKIFKGRSSMVCRDVLKEVLAIIDDTLK